MSRRQEDALDEVLIHPRFELTHPTVISIIASVIRVATYQRVVLGESGPAPGGGATEPMSGAGGVPLEKAIGPEGAPLLAGTPEKPGFMSMMGFARLALQCKGCHRRVSSKGPTTATIV
jgi:hypothetical protein